MKAKFALITLLTIFISFFNTDTYAAEKDNKGNGSSTNHHASLNGQINGNGTSNTDLPGAEMLGDEDATPLAVVEAPVQADTNAPLEDWIGVLVAAGAAFGMKKAHDRRKMEQMAL